MFDNLFSPSHSGNSAVIFLDHNQVVIDKWLSTSFVPRKADIIEIADKNWDITDIKVTRFIPDELKEYAEKCGDNDNEILRKERCYRILVAIFIKESEMQPNGTYLSPIGL
jgi:hypothetical protein